MNARPVLAALVLLAAPLAASAAEEYAILASTQSIQGTVPAGEDIRLEFPIAAGSEPRLTFSLSGAKPGQPISISELHLYGPDQQEYFLPSGAFFDIKFSNGNPTLTFKGWISTQSGNHQILIRTRARLLARAKGKLVVKRTTKIPVAGDENAPEIRVALQPGDVSRLTLKRVEGTAPKLIHYKLPSGIQTTPGQQLTKTGTKSNGLLAVQFGEHVYTVGYQDAEAPAGSWKGTLRIKAFHGGNPATLHLRNSPGIPLSVRDADRFVIPAFAGTGIGVATDGNFHVAVTSEQNGALMVQAYDTNLAASVDLPNPITLTSSQDFTPGETLSGHRFMFVNGFYYVGLTTTSATELELLRLRPNFVRDGYTQVVSASADPTTDFFMTGNTLSIAIGIFHPSNSHTLIRFNPIDFASRTTGQIGGAANPEMRASGAAWRPDDSVFEFWTSDTLDYHGPSDLHRTLFDGNWTPLTPDVKPVNDPTVVETMPTAVSVDGPTGVTFLHYVAADNPPLGNPPGSGKIHQRLFDAAGVEIPGSHKILPRASCVRPSSAILGNFLYLGYETQTGPVVERYPILR